MIFVKTITLPIGSPLKNLKKRLQKNKRTVECQHSEDDVSILKLLEGIAASLDKIKEFIISSKLEEALQLLHQHCSDRQQDDKIINRIYLQSSRFQSNEMGYANGTIEKTVYDAERLRITQSLLTILEQL